MKHETRLSLFFSFIVVSHSIGKLLTLSSILFVIILPCFSLIGLCSTPPEVAWERTYTDEQRGGIFAQETADGGFIVAASTSLLKTDASGNIVWELPYRAQFVQQTTDGGYIVAVPPESGAGMGLVKLDASAPPNEEWSVVFTEDDAGRATCVRQTSDGGYIIAGWENGGAPGTGDFLVKTDSLGVEEWRRAEGCYYCARYYRIIYRTDDGGFIGAGLAGSVHHRAYVLKLTEAGEILWDETYGPELGASSYASYGECVSPTDDGGYVVFGEILYERNGDRDIFMMKIDGEGTELWSRVYSNPQASHVEYVVEAPEGGYVVVGDTRSEVTSSLDIFVLKVDEMGNVMWEITLGTSDTDVAYSVGLTADGGYIIAGSVSTPPLNSLYLCKLTPTGGMNERPIADAGPDQTITDVDGNGSENVALDGSGSYDPDGSVESYTWFKNGTQIASGSSATVMLPIGVHAITLVVTDTDGGTDADETEVGVFPPIYVTTGLRVNRQQITPSFCSTVVGGPCFEDIAGLPYFVGDTLGATFTVTNTGSQPAALEQLVVGGRFNDGQLPDGSAPDFTAVGPITLQPQESFQYAGTLELAETGEYHFFCAYELLGGGWNTAVPLGEGLTDDDRTSDVSVRYRLPPYTGEVPSLELINLSESERRELYEIIRTVLAADEAKSELFDSEHGDLLERTKTLLRQIHPDPAINELNPEDVHDIMGDYLLEDDTAFAMDVVEEGVGQILMYVGPRIGSGWLYTGGLYFKTTADFLEMVGVHLVEQYYLRDLGSATVEWPDLGRLEVMWFRAEEKVIVNIYLAGYDKKGGLVISTTRWRDYYEAISTEHACSTLPVYSSLLGAFHEGLEDNILDRVQFIQMHSPAELRVFDGQGNAAGLSDGVVHDDIAGVIYVPEIQLIAARTEAGELTYETAGTADGLYSLRARSIEDGSYTPFEAVDMPIGEASSHFYDIDWDALARGEEGGSVAIDEDGDGSPEILLEVGESLEAKNTETGDSTSISFLEGSVSLEFDLVMESGNTFLSTTESLPTASQQQGIEFLSPFYEFTSTASYTGNISIALAYDDTSLTKYEEAALKLFKIAEDGTATDITTGLNTEQNLITGLADTFSSFAIGIVLSEVRTPAVFRVTREGDVRADGAYYGQSFETGSADVAEWVPVSEPVEPGDVLEMDPNYPGHYRKSRGPCSDLVAGIVSTDPGFILGSSPATEDSGLSTPDSVLLALIGIVPVKVTNEGGPIQPGDLLVSSSTPGHAMRWDPDTGFPCALIGKALEPLTEERGIILALLTAH